MEETKKRNIFFLAITALFLLYCIPIILQGTEDVRMVDTFQFDEGTAITVVSRMINKSSLYPGFFHYGALYFYIDCLVLWVIKTFSSLESVSDQLIIISLRLINITFAILCLGGLYILAHRIYNFSVAALASLFLITTPNIVFWSTTAHPDILQMFLIIVSIYFCTRLLEEYSFKSMALSTIFAGLSFGTKYSGIFLLPLICLISIISLVKQTRYKQMVGRILLVLMAICTLFLITFFISNPYALIKFKKFYQTLQFESAHVKFGHLLKADKSPFLWLKVLSNDNLLGKIGLALFLIFPALTIGKFIIKRAEKPASYQTVLFIMGWIFFFLLYLMWGVNYRPYRYLFPIIPFIYIFIARVITRLFYNQYPIKIPARLGQVAALGLVVWLLWPKFALSYNYFNESLHKVENSPAIAAGKYIAQNFPKNTKITCDYYSYVPSSFKKVLFTWGQNATLINKLKPNLIMVNDKISLRYKDLKKASSSKNPKVFRDCHLFYAKLEKNQFLPYQKIKDFGSIKIYKRF